MTPSIWRLDFELDAPLRFVPGQYVKLRVAPYEWRDYSIAAATDRRLTLLISNRTHGDGSDWADAVQPGQATEIEAPFGAYGLDGNGRRKVFVATGTGVAPFLAMFDAMGPANSTKPSFISAAARRPRTSPGLSPANPSARSSAPAGRRRRRAVSQAG